MVRYGVLAGRRWPTIVEVTLMSRVYGDQVERRPRPVTSRQGVWSFLAAESETVEPVSLLNLDPECLRDAVASWVSQGYAISFGQTSDGGAIGVHLIVGGDKKSKYFTTVAELEDFLTRVSGTIAPKK